MFSQPKPYNMKSVKLVLLFTISFCSFFTHSQTLETQFNSFDLIYKQQLGQTQGCQTPQMLEFKVCSSALKNDGNAPFILHHNKVTPKVVVLFHGLSDSPFFLKSIAKALHQQGHNVVVGLLPGHGKKQADADMRDPELADRWRTHVSEVMDFSASLGEQKYIGGFSTGGGLAAEYILLHPDNVKALMLFSGALALDSGNESMGKIWGVQWLVKLLDGDYQTSGPNPYKYPKIARHAGLELAEVIFSVRDLIDQGRPLNLPIFSGHSAADTTTPISGVKNLMAVNKGPNTLFEISKEFDVCHADVVVSPSQVIDMQYDVSLLEETGPCYIPQANPKHAEMLETLLTFMASH
jgi:pimeloyl-ACP methyl ester carboxylesterase